MTRSLLALVLSAAMLSVPACSGRQGPKGDPKPAGVTSSEPVDPVAALERLGAQFTRDEEGKPNTVTLAEGNVTDADLAHLGGMTSLESVNLFRTGVTDAGLVHLKGLKNLQYLVLTETEVSDAGLDHVAGLTSLRSLDLVATAVTDAGLAHLATLTNLEHLFLESTRVTDAGVEKLRQELPQVTVYR